MHPYSPSRLGTGRSVAATTTASTPSSPSSPRLRHGRSKFSQGNGSGGARLGAAKQSLAERVVVVLITSVFKRRGLLLFAPLLYISGMVLYMGSFSFDVDLNTVGGVVVRKRAPPGSVYRSPQVFEKLWPYMEAEYNGSRNAILESRC